MAAAAQKIENKTAPATKETALAKAARELKEKMP